MDDEKPPKFSWNQETFLIEGKPFYPDLTESGNTICVRLPCQPHSSLQWEIPQTSKYILWQFVCDLETAYFPLTDELRFHSLTLACKHFSQTIWPLYKEQTLGGILYRGSADFASHFLWNDLQKTNYTTWKETNPPIQDLFCADAFYSYLQLLAYQLPDELPLLLCFDPTPISSLSRAISILSRERFAHFLLAISNPKWPIPTLHWTPNSLSFQPLNASIGLCFPKNSSLTPELYFQLDKILHTFYESNSPFRIVFEEFLTEEWDHLDEIHTIPHTLSPQGRRKLLGFEAAGGKIREIT